MLLNHLRDMAGNVPVTSGLRAGDRFVSYAELVEKIERLASGLIVLGIVKGDRIAILLPNGPDFFMVVQAVATVGAIAVPVNPSSGDSELEWIGNKCRFAVLIAANNLVAVAKKISGVDGKTPIIPLSDSPGRDVESLLDTRPGNLPELGGDTVASYLLSSGSTGRPKLVPHTHQQLLASGRIAATSLKLTPEDVVLNALPAHHSLGFLSGCFEVPAHGATTLFWSDPGPMLLSRRRFFDLMREHKISVMPGVPYIYQTLAETSEQINLPHMRLIYSSGVALKQDIHEAFKNRFNLRLNQGYGCTETGMIALTNNSQVEVPWNSVGRPSNGVELSVLPVAGQPDGIGELFVRTPALVDGYVDATRAENASFVDGGYLTGDLGYVDEQGNLFITGRSKLLIEVAGEKVDPYEIEDVLCQSPAIAEAVIVGMPDVRTGEQLIKAFVVRKSDITAEQVVSFCRTRLMAFKVPQVVEFRDEIPKSSTGKILRGKLMEINGS